MRPFRIEVFDGSTTAFTKLGRVGNYLTADMTLRHNAAGAWSLLMDLSEPAVALLAAPGRRVTVDFEDDGSRLLSGPLHSIERIDEGRQRTVAFTGFDDMYWLDQRICFPVPGAALPADGTAFTQASRTDYRSGNAETVAKGFVTANAAATGRRPLPGLSVATNLNRGGTVAIGARMHSLLYITTLAARLGGLGARVDQVGNGLVFDVYQPVTQPVRLSENLGNLTSYRFVTLAPDLTHGVAGGQGESTARKFMRKTAPGSAVGWGAREKFIDARDVDSDTDLALRIDEALAEGAPKAGFSLTPQDTQSMKFGRDYNVGDNVTVELPGGTQVADTVTEVRLTHTSGEGLAVVPAVGSSEATDPSAEIYRRYRAIATKVDNIVRGF